TKNLLALGIDQHLHHPLGFAPFAGAGHLAHGHDAHKGLPARFAQLGLAHADATERGIDEEAIDQYAILDRARAAVEHIVGDDLEIIVGGVGERTATIDVAHGPDALDAGAQVIVDRDVAALVGLDARGLEV